MPKKATDKGEKRKHKDDERKKKMPNIKTKKRKTKERKAMTKKTRNKKRAKRINKARRRAAQKSILSAYFLRACMIAHRGKEKRTEQAKKPQKRRSLLLCAYHRQKAEQYRCDMSVLCLY